MIYKLEGAIGDNSKYILTSDWRLNIGVGYEVTFSKYSFNSFLSYINLIRPGDYGKNLIYESFGINFLVQALFNQNIVLTIGTNYYLKKIFLIK